MTVWRAVEGFDCYEVSDDGRVRRIKPTREKNHGKQVPYELSPWKDINGYPVVELRDGDRRKTYKVHRLVALAFIPNPDNKDQVAHNDGSRDNNCVSNLRWATMEENQADRKLHGTCNGIILKTAGEKNINAKLTDEDVVSIRRRHMSGETQSALAREYGVSQSQVHRIVSGQSWKWLNTP